MTDGMGSQEDRSLKTISADGEKGLVKALEDSEKNFRTMIEQIPDGIFIEDARRVLFVSQSVLRMLGYERTDELVGRPPLTFVHPDYHPVLRERNARIHAQAGVDSLVESQWLRKDGSRTWLEASSISIVYQDEPAIMTVLRDTGPRKKAEEALRRSDQNFKTIIQEMPNGVLIVDQERILYTNLNFARLLGYSTAEELVGKDKFQVIHPDYHSVVRERVDRILEPGGINPILRVKMIGKGGKTVDFESSSISIQFDGKPAVLGVLRDITLQNQMEHQGVLNEKLATVGTLATGIAHEINNPLTYVLGNLAFLEENLDGLDRKMTERGHGDGSYPETFKEMREELADSKQGGERIREIVRGLKSFVRSDTESVTMVDLNQTVDLAINMTLHEFRTKARVVRNFAQNLPALALNSGKILQVFINLLINAAQAIEGNRPDENHINIRTAREEGNLVVEITDTGKGIPDNILPHIFNPFYTTKPVGVGTGLGLSICHKIVEHYQGTMEVRSWVGKGTTFTVRLPVENGLKAGDPPSVPPAGPGLGRILVVDDEPSNLDLLSKFLKKKNEVLSAFTGVAALGILEREKGRIDVIVTDINMPDMDGMDLYRAVARKFPGLEKKVIFITGGITAEASAAFLKSVPNLCLEKPFNLQELKAAVSGLMETSTLRSEVSIIHH